MTFRRRSEPAAQNAESSSNTQFPAISAAESDS
jgi:hypothetical protein